MTKVEVTAKVFQEAVAAWMDDEHELWPDFITLEGETEGEKVHKLHDLVRVQSSKGNYDYSEYMRGMANGLIVALSVFDDKEPVSHEAPDVAHTPKSEEESAWERLKQQLANECCSDCVNMGRDGKPTGCCNMGCPCHHKEEKVGTANTRKAVDTYLKPLADHPKIEKPEYGLPRTKTSALNDLAAKLNEVIEYINRLPL